jgi:Zn-dependent peptidase ImmA (M78 family)
LEENHIQSIVDSLFENYQIDKEKPIDVELLINQIGLRLDIRQLEYKYDAFLKINSKEIVVNSTKYIEDRHYNRLKFSLAHELGHYILHESYIKAFNFKSLDDYLDFKKNIPENQYKRFEYQANLFAGLLLVNKDTLSKQIDEYLTDTWNNDSYNLIFHISNYFEVSEEVSSIRVLSILKNKEDK